MTGKSKLQHILCDSQCDRLSVALAYRSLGWCVIPIRNGTKRPACRTWKPYQGRHPTEPELRRWFGSGTEKSLAVVTGEVSGGLVCRDFDAMASYEQWTAQYSELARTLPTAETGRPGRHVYALADIDVIRAGSATDGGILVFEDGELRGAGYCLLPPSEHPSGAVYCWVIPPVAKIPTVDLRTCGFLIDYSAATESSREGGGLLRQPKNTEAIDVVCCSEVTTPTNHNNGSVVSGALCCTPQETNKTKIPANVEKAITDSLPKGPGKRNKQVFELARALKAIPELADASAKDLEPYVRRWHELAKPIIRTQPLEETRIDFLRAWPRVKFPKGAEPIQAIFEAAKAVEPPAVALEYEQPELRLLVILCRELQRAAGDRPFYLSCRTAGRLLGVDHATAWRWLFLLKADGVLDEVCKGSQAGRKATRYRYLPKL